MYIFGYRLPGMSSLVVWGFLWEMIGRADVTFFVPPLSEVLTTLYSIIGTVAFKNALAETAYAFSLGVFFAVTIGVITGIKKNSVHHASNQFSVQCFTHQIQCFTMGSTSLILSTSRLQLIFSRNQVGLVILRL